jgi:hypothetical protein
MAYLGNQPALSYTSFAKQDFTTSATTSYTLDNPVANANELALFINFVRQEPTTAYTASGTSLTLTSATSASDDMYCVYLGKAVQTVNPPSGSVGASQLADDAVTTAKILDANVSLAKLSATGTKDSTTFLRGDNTFAVVDTNTVIDLTSDLSGNGFGKMKLKYTEVSVSGTGFVYLGFCRQSTNCGGALGEHGIPLGFIPGVEYNASFTVGDLAVEPWPAGSNRYEYKVNISSFTTAGTLGIIYLGAST